MWEECPQGVFSGCSAWINDESDWTSRENSFRNDRAIQPVSLKESSILADGIKI
jgi:hypothetical protein